MKYEKRKKSKVIDAVQLNSLADAEKILKDCPHVYGIKVTTWLANDTKSNNVMLSLASEYLTVFQSEYFAWDDKNVWTTPADKFEKKYERVAPSFNGGTIKWDIDVPHAYSSTNGTTIKPI